MSIICVWLFLLIKISWVHFFNNTIFSFVINEGSEQSDIAKKKKNHTLPLWLGHVFFFFLFKTTNCIFDFVWHYVWVLFRFCSLLKVIKAHYMIAFNFFFRKWHEPFAVYSDHVSLTSIKTADLIRKMQLLTKLGKAILPPFWH